MVVVDVIGTSGSISIVWNPWGINMINIANTHHTPLALFHLLGTSIRGSLINVYGPLIPKLKNRMIDYLEGFVSQNTNTFTIIKGDFNMVISL